MHCLKIGLLLAACAALSGGCSLGTSGFDAERELQYIQAIPVQDGWKETSEGATICPLGGKGVSNGSCIDPWGGTKGASLLKSRQAANETTGY